MLKNNNFEVNEDRNYNKFGLRDPMLSPPVQVDMCFGFIITKLFNLDLKNCVFKSARMWDQVVNDISSRPTLLFWIITTLSLAQRNLENIISGSFEIIRQRSAPRNAQEAELHSSKMVALF